MTSIVIDPQSSGWRDDGTESGIVGVEQRRGNIVQMPFITGAYLSTTVGSAEISHFTQPTPTLNRDGVGTYLAVSVPSSASLANSLTVKFWINGNIFGLRFEPTANPIGCMIDGVAYSISASANIDPVSGSSPGGTIMSELEGVILARDLGDGKHFVELTFPAFLTGATRTYKIFGYLADSVAGYFRTNRNVVSLNASTVEITATTGAAGQKVSTPLGFLGWRKVLFCNTTAASITINMVYSTSKSTLIWSKSIAANDTIEFDPSGVVVDTNNVLFYASAVGINATPVAVN